ncbi:MAG: PEP-CTERM sorting domain-containing protein [Candidatus Omnitrophica bacterium]|nr:PEP-CTERM sorting domain-containing protein [Candidatus Omnitrophota bacterium]
MDDTRADGIVFENKGGKCMSGKVKLTCMVCALCVAFLTGCKGGGGGGDQYSYLQDIPHQPEPATIVMFGLGALGVFGARKFKKK